MSGGVYRRNHMNIKRYPHMYHVHCSSKVRIVSSPRNAVELINAKNLAIFSASLKNRIDLIVRSLLFSICRQN